VSFIYIFRYSVPYNMYFNLFVPIQWTITCRLTNVHAINRDSWNMCPNVTYYGKSYGLYFCNVPTLIQWRTIVQKNFYTIFFLLSPTLRCPSSRVLCIVCVSMYIHCVLKIWYKVHYVSIKRTMMFSFIISIISINVACMFYEMCGVYIIDAK
jgi:hypothetical protein